MAMMVPDGVRGLFLVVTGEEWPDANEDKLHVLAGAWESAGRGLSGELGPELRRAVAAVRSTFSGAAEQAFAARMSPFVEGADNYVDAAAEQFHGLAQYLHDLAVDVEYVKLVSVLSLGALAVEIAWASAAAAETGGASVVWLAQRVALVRYLLKSALGRLALRLAQAELVGMAFQAVIDILAQGMQFAMGTRHTWNTGYTTNAFAVGALGGVLMLPLSAVGEVLARAAAQGVESVLSKFAKFAKSIPSWAHTVPELVSEIGVEAFHEVFTETLYNFLTTGEFSMNGWSATSGGISGMGGAAGRSIRHKGIGHAPALQIHNGHNVGPTAIPHGTPEITPEATTRQSIPVPIPAAPSFPHLAVTRSGSPPHNHPTNGPAAIGEPGNAARTPQTRPGHPTTAQPAIARPSSPTASPDRTPVTTHPISPAGGGIARSTVTHAGDPTSPAMQRTHPATSPASPPAGQHEVSIGDGNARPTIAAHPISPQSTVVGQQAAPQTTAPSRPVESVTSPPTIAPFSADIAPPAAVTKDAVVRAEPVAGNPSQVRNPDRVLPQPNRTIASLGRPSTVAPTVTAAQAGGAGSQVAVAGTTHAAVGSAVRPGVERSESGADPRPGTTTPEVADPGVRVPTPDHAPEAPSSDIVRPALTDPVLAALAGRPFTDFRDWLPRINAIGGTHNCVYTAAAVHNTWQGRPEAAAREHGPNSVWQKAGGFADEVVGYGHSAVNTVASRLLAAGHGASALVRTIRAGAEVGHVWNMINQNGVVYHVDGQPGDWLAAEQGPRDGKHSIGEVKAIVVGPAGDNISLAAEIGDPVEALADVRGYLAAASTVRRATQQLEWSRHGLTDAAEAATVAGVAAILANSRANLGGRSLDDLLAEIDTREAAMAGYESQVAHLTETLAKTTAAAATQVRLAPAVTQMGESLAKVTQARADARAELAALRRTANSAAVAAEADQQAKAAAAALTDARAAHTRAESPTKVIDLAETTLTAKRDELAALPPDTDRAAWDARAERVELGWWAADTAARRYPTVLAEFGRVREAAKAAEVAAGQGDVERSLTLLRDLPLDRRVEVARVDVTPLTRAVKRLFADPSALSSVKETLTKAVRENLADIVGGGHLVTLPTPADPAQVWLMGQVAVPTDTRVDAGAVPPAGMAAGPGGRSLVDAKLQITLARVGRSATLEHAAVNVRLRVPPVATDLTPYVPPADPGVRRGTVPAGVLAELTERQAIGVEFALVWQLAGRVGDEHLPDLADLLRSTEVLRLPAGQVLSTGLPDGTPVRITGDPIEVRLIGPSDQVVVRRPVSLPGLRQSNHTEVVRGATDTTLVYQTRRRVAVSVGRHPGSPGYVDGVTALPVLDAARLGLPVPRQLAPDPDLTRTPGTGRYRIGTDEILGVPGRQRIGDFVADGLDLAGRAAVGSAFADDASAAAAVFDALHGGLQITWAAGERTVLLEVHAEITPPAATFPSPRTDATTRDQVTNRDNASPGMSKVSVVARGSGFPGAHRGFTGDLELVVVRREVVESKVVRRTLFGDPTEPVRLVEPTAADVATALDRMAVNGDRGNLRATRVSDAVVVSTPADKLAWVDEPTAATPGFSPGLYVGEPPPLAAEVAAHAVPPELFGPFVSVEHARMSPAMVEAPHIALAAHVEAVSGRARPAWLPRSGTGTLLGGVPGPNQRERLLVPGTSGWPSWRRHPETGRVPPPAAVRSLSTQGRANTESRVDNQGGSVRYREAALGSELTSWGRRELVESTRDDGTPGRVLRYRLSPLTRPGSATATTLRTLAAQHGARYLAVHGINGELGGIDRFSAKDGASSMTGTLSGRVRFFAPRVVDIRVDGFLRRRGESHSRTGDAGAMTDLVPGSHQEFDYRGPTAFVALDARYTFTGEVATRLAETRANAGPVAVTVDEPEAVLVQMPLRNAVELLRVTGMPEHPGLSVILDAQPDRVQSVGTQQLLPIGSGYVAYGPAVVTDSWLRGSDPLAGVRARLGELGVTGIWATQVEHRIIWLFSSPSEFVNLTEALGGVHAVSVPGVGAHVAEIVDIRVTARRTTAHEARLTTSTGKITQFTPNSMSVGGRGPTTGSWYTDTYPTVDRAHRDVTYTLVITRKHVASSPVSALTLTAAHNANRAAEVRTENVLGAVGLAYPNAETSPPMSRPQAEPTVTVLDHNPPGAVRRATLDPDSMWSVEVIGSATTAAVRDALYAQLGGAPPAVGHSSIQDLAAAAARTSRYTEVGTPSELAIQKLTTGQALRTAARNLFTGGSAEVNHVPGSKETLGVRISARLVPNTFTLVATELGASSVVHSREVAGGPGVRQGGPSYLFTADAEFYVDTPAGTVLVTGHQDVRIRVWESDALHLTALNLTLAHVWQHAGVTAPEGLAFTAAGDGVMLHLESQEPPDPPKHSRSDGRALYVAPNVPGTMVVDLVRGLPLRTRPTVAYSLSGPLSEWTPFPLPKHDLGTGPIALPPKSPTTSSAPATNGTGSTARVVVSRAVSTNSVDAVLAYHTKYNTAPADWTQHPLEYMGSGAHALGALIDRVTLAGHGSAALVFGRLPDGTRHGWNLVNQHNRVLLIDPHLGTTLPASPGAIPGLGLVHAVVLNADNHYVGGSDLPAGVAHEYGTHVDAGSPNWQAHLDRVDTELHDLRQTQADLGSASPRSSLTRRIAALGQHRQRVIAHHIRAAAERGTVIELPDHEGLLVPYRGGWVLLSHTPTEAGTVAHLATTLNGNITAMVVDPNLNNLRHLKFPPRGRPLPVEPAEVQ